MLTPADKQDAALLAEALHKAVVRDCADDDVVLTLLSPTGVATFTYAECRAKAAELVQRMALEHLDFPVDMDPRCGDGT